jgi:cation:H+ antiporter
MVQDLSNWFLFFGFAMFALGSQAAMRGGAAAARALGLTPLPIGLLVIPAAASLPALFVTFHAVDTGMPDFAVGGIIGGAILSLLLLQGIGALIHPLASSPKLVFRDGSLLIVACLALVLFAANGRLSPLEGVILLALYGFYLLLGFATDWRRSAEHSVARERALALERSGKLGLSGGLFVAALGVVAVLVGAHFTIAGGAALARDYDLPPYAVGLTLVALSITLPEFLVVTGGAMRGRADIAIGQTAGSNIFNLLFVFGSAAAIRPLTVAGPVARADLYVLAVVAALLPLVLVLRWRLSRPRGFFLVLGYGFYLAFLGWRLQSLSLPAVKFW